VAGITAELIYRNYPQQGHKFSSTAPNNFNEPLHLNEKFII